MDESTIAIAVSNKNRKIVDNFSLETAYIATSMLVALSIGVQTWVLYRNQGRVQLSSPLSLLSFLDVVWFVLTLAALWWLDFDAIAMSVPVLYVIYTVLSFFYAANSIEGDEPPANPEDVVFGKKYLNFNASFVVVFLGWCGYVLFLA